MKVQNEFRTDTISDKFKILIDSTFSCTWNEIMLMEEDSPQAHN